MDVYKKIGKEKPLISDFYRRDHLQQIEHQIENTVLSIGKKEASFTEDQIRSGIQLGTKTVSDTLGAPMLNKSAVDQLVKHPWAEGDFSSRIWNNKAKLISSMKSELTAGIVKGDGIYKVANRLDDRMNVGKSDTQRLVRTEYMHALNAGQVETYRKQGYKKLMWSASMDNRGCDTCHGRNNKVYDIDNLPDLPAHPNCRCTWIPQITDEMIGERAQKLQEAKEKVERLVNMSTEPLGNGTIDIEIDEFTPCLRDMKTGRLVDTQYGKTNISSKKAKALKSKGWLFDWSRYNDHRLIQLNLKGSKEIQGLVTFQDREGFTFVDLVESAPNNRGTNKRYAGVGGHLFAIAAEESFKSGNDGYVSFTPKTNLVEYYAKSLGAQMMPNGNMFLDTEASLKLIEVYLKGSDSID